MFLIQVIIFVCVCVWSAFVTHDNVVYTEMDKFTKISVIFFIKLNISWI